MARKTLSKRPGKVPVPARAAPWAALGLVVVVLALLATKGPAPFIGLLNRVKGQATGALNLTILHTNDTYGYVLPCG